MNPVIAAAVLLLVVVAGSYGTFRRLPFFPNLRYLYLFGTEFFLVGIALGPQTTEILDRETLYSLEPVFSLALAWIGMLYGLQFNIPQVASLRKRTWAAAFVQFVVTSGTLYVVIVHLPRALGLAPLVGPGADIALTMALSPAALPFMMVLYREGSIGLRRELYPVRYLAALDDLFPLAVLLAVSLFPATRPARLTAFTPLETALSLGGITVGIALVTALVIVLLLDKLLKPEQLFLVVVGGVLCAAGLAEAVGVSPLLAGVLTGMVVANMSSLQERVAQTMSRMEKPIYLLLLLLMGAYVTFDIVWWHAVAFPVALFAARTAAKLLAGHLMSGARMVRGNGTTIGVLLLPVGSMSVAIAGAFALAHPAQGQTVILLTLGTLMVSDAVTPLAAHLAFRRGER